ncbi:MAG: aldose 1-epimerase family protein [Actinomycetales bacterium]|nr:aldose 1-epimerase family protein [Actinomycetales bacterium]
MTRWAELIDDGRVSLPDAVATVDELTGVGGRRLALRLAGGLTLDVLPDRGLDLGSAWWAGVPVAWRSPNPVDPGPPRAWEDRFLGGLLATCGPDNIGEPRAGSGQHGTHHVTPAYDVSWRRERTPDGFQVRVRGSVAHTSLGGPRIVVEREIVAGTGVAAVEVVDVVRNVGDRPVGVPLLYHVNLGAPLLRPGARLDLAAGRPVTREPLPPGRDPLVTPAPRPGLAPVVAEHPVLEPRATLAGDADHPDVEITWDLAALPRLYTWSWPASGAYVLGVEPANAPLFGPERDLPHAGAPVLEPGQTWRTGVRVEIRAHRSEETT